MKVSNDTDGSTVAEETLVSLLADLRARLITIDELVRDPGWVRLMGGTRPPERRFTV